MARGRWLLLCVLGATSCGENGGPGTPTAPDGGKAGRSRDAGTAARDATTPPNADATAALPDAARDASPAPSPDPGRGEAGLRDAAAPDDAPIDPGHEGRDAAAERDAAGPGQVTADALVPGWSIRKRIRSLDGQDVVLEEVPSSFADEVPGVARLRLLSSGANGPSWTVPSGTQLSDFCRHPSGELSAILVAPDRTVSIERLSPDLTATGTLLVRDPSIAGDPHVTEAGDLDLRVNGLARDPAHIASVDDAIVAVVDTSWNSVIAYRSSFTGGTWTPPVRTLIEPPAPITRFLPIGGSFDTFDAMFATFRSLLDVDEAGNAYVASWASARRIQEHVNVFHDGLVPLPGDPDFPDTHDADILVTRMDRSGARAWTTVIGTLHEDDIYAMRAHAGAVAVVGRARRFPGFDNTFWDAFVSVVSTDGEFDASRVLPLEASSLFLTVDALPGGGWVLGGSDGWSQNPGGLSVTTFGTKLLAVLPTLPGPLTRIPLPPGPRNNQIRSAVWASDRIWFGGLQDGPIMHTGDTDRGQIFATGVLGSVNVR